MLYVFHGTDTLAAVQKATTLVGSLRTKKADASYVRIEAQQWTPSIIEEHLGGQGLFSNKYIILLDRVTENAEAKAQLPEWIKVMNESSNIFIVLEGKINTELKKAFDAGAEKVVECVESVASSAKGVPKKEEFNIFALADAVGSRNALQSWSLYRKAVDAGTEPENIVGTLFWQVKSMALAAHAGSASDAGLSPFVFSKAKKHAGNYSAEELAQLTTSLIMAYHDGHRGKGDMELVVEMVMLGLRK